MAWFYLFLAGGRLGNRIPLIPDWAFGDERRFCCGAANRPSDSQQSRVEATARAILRDRA
jgi:hypothetical protein